MYLRVRHGARVEPHVNQVKFATHRLAGGRHQYDTVHVWTVHVYLLVVLAAHVAGDETVLGDGVLGHHAGCHSLVYFAAQFLVAADYHLLGAIIRTPDRQRSAPVARARQVPVLHVLQPLAEAAGAGGGGLPLDGVVQLHQARAGVGRADKPAVKRVIQHGLVGAPAVRVVVYVLLSLKGFALFLKLYAQLQVQVVGGRCGSLIIFTTLVEFRVVCVLDVCSGMIGVERHIHALLHETFGQVLYGIETALQIHHRASLTALVYQIQRRDIGGLGHLGVVGTERGRDVYDTRTVLGRHVVAGYHAECLALKLHELVAVHAVHLVGMSLSILAHVFGRMVVEFLGRFHPGHKLLVVHAY